MVRKDGEYYYAPHRRRWGIWQWHVLQGISELFGVGTFIKDCKTKDEAKSEVYRLNGWKEKKE